MDDDSMKLEQMLASKPCIVVYPSLIKLVDDIPVGMVLSQLVYWFSPDKKGKSRLRVSMEGRLWLAKMRTDWETECGLTPRQVDRALSVLKGMALIDVRHAWFGGKYMIHLWLDKHRLTAALAEVQGVHPEVNTPHQQVNTPSPVGESSTELLTETLQESARVKLEQVLKSHEQKDRGNSLIILWKNRIATLTGEFVKPLTLKDESQIRGLTKALGPEAHGVLDWMLQNWPRFSTEVGGKKGLSVIPTAPQPGFCLQHYDVAVQLIAKSKSQSESLAQGLVPKDLIEIDKGQKSGKVSTIGKPMTEEEKAELAAKLGLI